MPFLLYCVAPESTEETSVKGVGGAAVRSSKLSGLKFFFSEIATGHLSCDIVTAAKQVHAVVSDIFSHGPVLPFRYPTSLANEVELAELASTRGSAFRQYFQRVGSKVQMDVRLTTGPSAADETPTETGRGYLEGRARCQARLSAAAEKCRQVADSADWRSYRSAENIRCQALISRVEVVSFYERMRALKLPEGVEAAVSGPWPPAGFWEDEPR